MGLFSGLKRIAKKVKKVAVKTGLGGAALPSIAGTQFAIKNPGLVAAPLTGGASSLLPSLSSFDFGSLTSGFENLNLGNAGAVLEGSIKARIDRKKAELVEKFNPAIRQIRGVAPSRLTEDVIVSPGGGSSLPPGVRGVPAMAGLPAVAGAVFSTTGKILRFVTPSGRKFSRKQVVDLAKKFGPEVAAGAVGASLAEIMAAIMDETTTRRRRRRGITPRDLQTTRNTINRIKRMHAMLPTRTTRARTKTSCR